MSRRRILHFLWSGNIGGAQRAVYQLIRASMEADEWEVGVAFGKAEGPYAEAIRSLGCEVIDLHMRCGADLPRALAATEELRRFDIHHFHVLEPCQMMASVRCNQATRVFTQRHGIHTTPESLSKRARRILAGAMLRRRFQAVSGNTQHATRQVIDRYKLRQMPWVVTYNGIDFSLLAPQRNRVDVRRELNANPESIVVGSSGTFKSWKRFDRVVDLLEAGPRPQVVLVGDGALRSALEARAKALGASDRLHITGLVQNVADYLQAMDVFVLPSTADESFGNSVVEAMSLGIPSVVFSDSPGICEHIDHGLTGFVVDNQIDLLSVVEALAADAGLRSRVGLAGARHVRSAYTLENMRRTYRTLYDLAVAAHDPERRQVAPTS